jgi:acyl-CoA synthetase (NDP forming)
VDKFFHPDSISVIGASKRKLGGQVLQNLLSGYRGSVYPVNPNYEEILGLPCFPSLESIPHNIDLAIVVVPAALVPAVLEACGRKGVKRVIIESAGFAEVGKEGRALQEQCKTIAGDAGIRVWGPNCMGLVDVWKRHFFTFMSQQIYEDELIPGRISLIVQSGMLSAIFLAELSRREIGVSKACSIGNRMDLDECDLLQYFLEDPETDVVALYLESMPRGRLFADIAKRADKPIVLLKGGKSESGARAALSHTYSLSGNSRLQDSVLRMCGVILADDIYQMMDIANALTMISEIPSESRAAIMTLSGGAGILACDALERHGIKVAHLSEKTEKALAEIFPDWMPVANPIDLFPAVGVHGREIAFNRTISIVLEDPKVDILLIHYIAGLGHDYVDFESLKKKADKEGKAIFFWFMGRREGLHSFLRQATANRLAAHGEITRIAECLAAARSRHQRLKTVSPSPVPEEASEEIRNDLEASATRNPILDEYDSKRLLQRWDLPVVEERLVNTVEDALNVAQILQYPIVLKGLVPGETHKTESGLVRLDIKTRGELENAYHEIQKKIDGSGRLLIQKHMEIDYELIAGFLLDREFGPCVMFGSGGILTELEPDVVFALAPLGRQDALELMGRIRRKRLLKGFRGMALLDTERMADILVRLGKLGTTYPLIEQIDINPFAVHRGLPTALDAAIILNKGVPH